MDDYFAAKAALFTPERARRGLVCTEDDWGRALVGRSGIPVQTLGTDPAADWRVVPGDDDPAAFRLVATGVDLHLRSSLPGGFNVLNTAMAAAALVLLAALSACAPNPRYCSPQPDRFDTTRGFTRENYAEVHPVMAVSAVAFSAVGLLAGHRCG